MTTPNSDLPARNKSNRRFHLVAFIRVDAEDREPMAYEEALKEKQQQELMSPENAYRIEEIPQEQNLCDSP